MSKVTVFTEKKNYFGQSTITSFGQVDFDENGCAEIEEQNLKLALELGFKPILENADGPEQLEDNLPDGSSEEDRTPPPEKSDEEIFSDDISPDADKQSEEEQLKTVEIANPGDQVQEPGNGAGSPPSGKAELTEEELHNLRIGLLKKSNPELESILKAAGVPEETFANDFKKDLVEKILKL